MITPEMVQEIFAGPPATSRRGKRGPTRKLIFEAAYTERPNHDYKEMVYPVLLRIGVIKPY